MGRERLANARLEWVPNCRVTGCDYKQIYSCLIYKKTVIKTTASVWWKSSLTTVTVHIDVFVSDVVFVVVDVTDDNRQSVRPTHCRMSAVLHDYRQMVLLLLFPVKLPQTHYNSTSVAILTTTLAHTQQQCYTDLKLLFVQYVFMTIGILRYNFHNEWSLHDIRNYYQHFNSTLHSNFTLTIKWLSQRLCLLLHNRNSQLSLNEGPCNIGVWILKSLPSCVLTNHIKAKVNHVINKINY